MYHETIGEGPPVVRLHGLTGTHRYWRPLVDALKESRQTIAPDLVGFGASQWPSEGYSLDDQIRYITPILPPTFDLIGHSMGSLIALELALRMPERTRHLVVLAPPSFTDWAPLICHVHEFLGGLSFYLYRPFVNPV